MALPSAAVLANRIRDTLISLDPDGFGSLSSADRATITSKMFTAIATEFLAVLADDMQIDVSVSGSTASACSAGGATGTCSATGSGVVS